ncbi:MAG: guanylate kinase [Actinomycetota bacterium]|nr:guanylate kinase [Actinomycetota bacterium]MDA2980558.1 guanylate kinase [Actinomycetota bacterium]
MTKDFDAVAASRRGVEMRRLRAEFKKQLRAGEHRLITVFDDAEDPRTDPVVRGLRVEWFLRSIPGFGATKTRAVLDRVGVSPTATLGGLRVRQRAALRGEVLALYRRYFPHQRGRLIVLAGPSGVGKGTVVSWITSRFPHFVVSVSATTRPRRPGEREGEHYYFVSPAEFQALIARGDLLEWAVVHGEHRYGTPRGPVEALLDEGRNVILEIDVQGAKQVKRAVKGALTIFIAPPSFEALEDRLSARGTESEPERKRRLVTAERELRRQKEFDYVVVNDSVERAGQSIVDLALASRDPQATKE